MNKISATGRLAADSELRFTQDGKPVISFRLASGVGFGDKKTTNWFNCTGFGKRWEGLANHLSKGSQVTVFGTLTMREWKTKEGEMRLSPDINLDDISLQGGKQEGKMPDWKEPALKPPVERNAQGGTRAPAGDFIDEIPFAPLNGKVY